MHHGRLPPLRLRSFAALAAIVFVACGGSVASPGNGNGGSAAGPTGGGAGSGAGGGAGGSTTGNGGARCDGLPECDPGDHKVKSESECPQDDVKCYSRETCGVKIWCWGPVGQCAAVPTCPSGMEETKTCPADAKCVDLTMCGMTIHCTPVCEGPPPICDPGDSQVKSPNDCPADTRCYSRTTCNYTIWCTGPAK